MSNGYKAGVREARPGEVPPSCWDCTTCGVGEPCFCATPARVRERCPAVELLTGYSESGYTCSLPAGHDAHTILCVGSYLRFSALGGAWRVRLAGAGINASAVMNGYVTLDNGRAGTYSIRHGDPRPWPSARQTFYLG